ncbi:transcription elongation factor [Photobacterium sanctipauli]|uniref:Transcription elongation factor n=1 Tax=Photobacterium sanctipauli TaxID=1342794 RepID=A0A2T3NX28_9GAMM|nr:GreA/GreB family elongation factor [Photobacterium sanctipauli]PSW20816.1 transcription elongation factor [Photobacterium sanctipauli]
MNKDQLIDLILAELNTVYQSALDATERAQDTATDDQNVAENQYDTLALEAAYLAHGQAQRAAECRADITAYQKLKVSMPADLAQVKLGCVIHLIDIDDNDKYVFFGPAAGGLKVVHDGKEIVVVTPNSPFGEALIGREQGDEVDVHIANNVVYYDVEAIY